MARRLLPGRDFFVPAATKEARRRRATVERARRGTVVHLSHDDCLDGVGSDVVVRLKHGSDAVSTVFTHPGEVASRLEAIAGAGIGGEGRALLLSDLGPQLAERERLEAALGELNELGWRIEWRDHHAKQWGQGVLEALRRKLDHLRVDLDNEECGTSIVQQDLLPHDAYAAELAAVVRDIDLWIRKDPRSEALTHALHALGSEALVAKLVRDRVLLDGELEEAASRHRRELERDLSAAVARARVLDGKRRVGVLYGDFPGSQACDALRRARGTDVEVTLRPDGEFSIRSRPELPLCHLVAQRFGGGGHPNASGGRLRLPAWEWPLYWLRGGRARRVEELVRLAAEIEAAGDTRGGA